MNVVLISEKEYKELFRKYALDNAEVIGEKDPGVMIKYTFTPRYTLERTDNNGQEKTGPLQVFRCLEIFHSSEFLEYDTDGVLDLRSKFVPSCEIERCLDELRKDVVFVTAEYAFFDDRTNFSGIDFDDGTSFEGAVFGDGTSFDGTNIGDETSFKNAAFGDGTSFDGSNIGDGTNFKGVISNGRISFKGSVIGDGVKFSKAKSREG